MDLHFWDFLAFFPPHFFPAVFFFAGVRDLYTGFHAEAIGRFISFLSGLPTASAPFWMFASVVVVCLTAIHISSKK